MYLDKVKINIKAGNGGSGKVSFIRNAQTEKGGPDGGDGGNGGAIIFVAKKELNTLSFFEYRKVFKATDGGAGGAGLCNGKNGEDVIIEVPCGTILKDAKTGKVLCDLYNDNERYVAIRGGRGGKGNNFFKSSTRRSPAFSQLGEEMPARDVILELKTIADVALVGKPNVGKSTLLSVISNAKPKIANYEFTTLNPNLGVVKMYDGSFIVADIPGLIEGASEGVGLGHDFLRHIERTRLILHVIDGSGYYGNDTKQDYLMIRNELKKYNKELYKRPEIIVLTKLDLIEDEQKVIENLRTVTKKNAKIFAISSITRKNVDELLKEVYKTLSKIEKPQPQKIEQEQLVVDDTTSLNIEKVDAHTYSITGGYIQNLQRGIVFTDSQSKAYFEFRLKKDGIIDKIKQFGAKTGDILIFGDLQFEIME